MRSSVRGRLFVLSLLLISVVGCAAGLMVEHTLQGWLYERLEAELARQAVMTREALALLPDVDRRSVDRLVDRLAQASASRVSVVGADGELLGDSEVDHDGLARSDNHRLRPEILQAQREGLGSALRYSTTVREEMLYVAVPVPLPGGTGVVRAAMPLAEISSLTFRLRMLLIVTGLVALLLAGFMSGVASHLFARTLANLVEHARSLVRGEGRRIDIRTSDEIGHLAGSFNQLAAELDRSVSLLGSERLRFEAVLESMSEAVIALDADATVTLVNPAARALLELQDDPRGRAFQQAINVPALHGLVNSDGARAQALEVELGPGSPRHVAARATPLRGGGTVIVMHDVTEIRRLETVRRDFVANVSHELRTPVSIIRANAETLLEGALEDPKAAQHFLRAVLRNSERLSRIIADLLDLARIEAGRFSVELKPLRLQEAVAKTVEALQESARAKQIQIHLEPCDELTAMADAKAFDQVLFNLLDNAIKYSPNGSQVVVRGEITSTNMVRVLVEDNGPGIDAKHQQRIFERFYRVDPGRSRDMGGTGLGLSIVRHLVEYMDGSVGFEARRPQGSSFWFTMRNAAVAKAC